MKFLPISNFDRNTKSTRPIWGINTAAESDLGMVGDILVTVPNPNGGTPERLVVQPTWLPQELTRVIPRKRLLDSIEFRQAVENGLISLISITDAERLLRQEGAEEEQAKIRQRAREVRQAGAPRTLAESKTEISRSDGVVEDDDDDGGRNKTVIIDHNENKSAAVLAANGPEDVEEGISVRFKIWADRVILMKDVQAKNEVKSQRKFSSQELRYLSRVLPRTSTNTLAMVNNTLSKMSK